MTRFLTPLLALLSLLVAAPAAGAATYFVNQSNAVASDSHPCTNRRGPCLTISGAVAKAKASSGNTVTVLADPAGTKDVYAEHPFLDGNPITLSGAGADKTEVSGGIEVDNASTVRTLGVQGRVTAIAPTPALLDRVAVEAQSPGGAYIGNATVLDSVLDGHNDIAASVKGGRLVRCALLGGVLAFHDTIALSVAVLNTVIRSNGAAGPAGLLLDSPGGSVRLRHVTFRSFGTRADIRKGSLEAANTTFAGKAGTTDLRLDGPDATATLRSSNLSATRTAIDDGAAPGQLAQTDSMDFDVDSNVTPDGRLVPGSLLIDRGTTAGALAGDPDDALDIDRAPRAQGAAPDVGADETGSAAAVPPPGGGQVPDAPSGGSGGSGGAADRTPASLTALKVPRSFHARCRRARKGARKCRTGLLVTYRLSEAATVQFSFKRRRRGSRAVVVKRPASAGKVSWRFTGKVKGRALPNGVYTLVISTTDLAGNRSRAITKRVTVN